MPYETVTETRSSAKGLLVSRLEAKPESSIARDWIDNTIHITPVELAALVIQATTADGEGGANLRRFQTRFSM